MKYFFLIFMSSWVFGQKNTELKDKNIDQVILTSKTDERALKIIKKVNDLFTQNSPQSLDSYYFQSYMKAAADMHPDSLNELANARKKRKAILEGYWVKYPELMQARKKKNDSIKKIYQDKRKKSDTAKEVNIGGDYFEKNALFVWEKAQEYLYKKGKGEKINILDNRLSGLKNPIYEMMSFQTNLNKIPKQLKWENRLDYTYFLYPDEVINSREVYVIRYREKALKNKLKNTLNGYVYIDKQTHGVMKIEHQSKKVGKIAIKSEWKYLFGKWFMEKEEMKIAFGNVNIREPKNPIDSLNKIKNKTIADTTKTKYLLKIREYLVLKHQFLKFESPKEFKNNQFGDYSISIKNSDGSLMDSFRTDSLNIREKSAYKNMDSIGGKLGFDRKIGLLQSLMSGKIRYKKIDFDLFNSLNYNSYEGLRLQLGAKTNEKFSKILSPDAYIAYGFLDNKWKYNMGIDIKTSQNKDNFIRFAYENDVKGAGDFGRYLWDNSKSVENFSLNKRHKNFVNYQHWLIRFKNDFTNELSVQLDHRLKNTQALFDYSYLNENRNFKEFSSILSLHYSPGIKNIMTPRGKYTIENAKAHFYLNYEKSWKIAGGEFDFHRIDFLIEYPFLNFFGKANTAFYGGILIGESPIWNAYEAEGQNSGNASIFGISSFKSPIGMGSLAAGTYFHNRYLGYYFEQELPIRLALKGKNTSFSLVYKSLIGSYKNNENTSYSTPVLDKYYQEAGVFWNKFMGISFINAGFTYKFGAYHDAKFMNNVGLQMGFNLSAFSAN